MQENLVRGRAFDFDGGGGGGGGVDGGMGDLVWVRIFFSPQQLDDVRFFPPAFLFSVQNFFFRQVFPSKKYFFLEISLQDIFPEIIHTLPLKSQMVGPLRCNVHPPGTPLSLPGLPFLILITDNERF